MRIRAVVFDMDGLLIDSEPMWREAEIVAFREAGLELTEAQCLQTMGLRLDEAVAYWFAKNPGLTRTEQQVGARIEVVFNELVDTQAVPMPGVLETLDFCREKGLAIGLASSTVLPIIEHILEKFRIRGIFQTVCSAAQEQYGKPHPAVYLRALDALGVPPLQSLAFEDSVTGLISAKAARMKAIAVPDPDHFHDPRYAIADAKLASLHEFTPALFEELCR